MLRMKGDERRQEVKEHHVLVVDDDPSIRQVLVDYFDEHHVQASAVSGQTELRRHLAATDPCLILLDLCLGQDGDGLEILKDLRIYSDVPIIVMTGRHLDAIDRAVGLELGADDYILKPFDLRELLARVRAVLRRRKMGPLSRMDRGGFSVGGWRL
jgi:two-component system OmpR family response regulator